MSRSHLSMIITILLAAPTAFAATGADAITLARDRATLARDSARQAEDTARLNAETAELQRESMETLEDEEKPSDAEALAIAALEGLFAAPPQRALPLVRKVLAGNQSERVKARAVFVLSQIEGPEAAAALAEAARSAQGKVGREAVRALGIRGDRASLDLLKTLYASADAKRRRTVIEAMTIANDRASLYALAQAAKTDEESRRLVEALAMAGGHEELRALAKSGVSPRNLVTAFALSNDLDGLLDLARREGDEKLQREAITQIGIIGSDKARAALQEFYRSARSDGVREAALHGMMIGNDEKGLLALYRSEQDAKRKRELLRTLTMIGGDAAFEAIDAAIEGRAP